MVGFNSQEPDSENKLTSLLLGEIATTALSTIDVIVKLVLTDEG